MELVNLQYREIDMDVLENESPSLRTSNVEAQEESKRRIGEQSWSRWTSNSIERNLRPLGSSDSLAINSPLGSWKSSSRRFPLNGGDVLSFSVSSSLLFSQQLIPVSVKSSKRGKEHMNSSSCIGVVDGECSSSDLTDDCN